MSKASVWIVLKFTLLVDVAKRVPFNPPVMALIVPLELNKILIKINIECLELNKILIKINRMLRIEG